MLERECVDNIFPLIFVCMAKLKYKYAKKNEVESTKMAIKMSFLSDTVIVRKPFVLRMNSLLHFLREHLLV